MDNDVFASLNFINASGAVLERVTLNALHHIIMLNLPMWHGYDTPGSMIHIEDGALKLSLTGEKDEMFITNGFYDENKLFFDSVREKRTLTTNISECISSMRLAEAVSLGRGNL